MEKLDHEGVELSLVIFLNPSNTVSTNITYGDHRYDFETDTSMREKIRVNNQIDTSPKIMANLLWNIDLNEDSSLAFEIEHMDSYFTDAANLHEYEGHTLYHTRLTRNFSESPKGLLKDR